VPQKRTHPQLKSFLIVLCCTLLTSTARLFWKLAAMRLPEILTNWQLWCGFVLYAIAAIVLLQLFKTGEVSVLFPIFATSYIWVALIAQFYLGEPLTIVNWAGMLCVFAGAILVGGAAQQKPQEVAL